MIKRNYGLMDIVQNYKEILNTTEPDYFSSKVTFEFWLEQLRIIQNNKRYKKPKTIAGIGVYTGSDSLNLVNISPYRLLSEISYKEAKKYLKVLIKSCTNHLKKEDLVLKIILREYKSIIIYKKR